MLYKYVIFDVDGTLLDTKSLYVQSLRKALKGYNGGAFADEELGASYGKPGLFTLRSLGVAESDLAGVHKSMLSNYERAWDTVKLFRGIAELLDTLKSRGHALAVATSRCDFEMDADRAFKPIMGFFDAVACSEIDMPPKPCPDILEKALKLLGITPGQAVYIGDTDYDRIAAEAAGMRFVGAGWGHEEEELAGKAWEVVCRKPSEILAIV
jgi:HAD superfamily hydrolase (TIGR01509 family)